MKWACTKATKTRSVLRHRAFIRCLHPSYTQPASHNSLSSIHFLHHTQQTMQFTLLQLKFLAKKVTRFVVRSFSLNPVNFNLQVLDALLTIDHPPHQINSIRATARRHQSKDIHLWDGDYSVPQRLQPSSGRRGECLSVGGAEARREWTYGGSVSNIHRIYPFHPFPDNGVDLSFPLSSSVAALIILSFLTRSSLAREGIESQRLQLLKLARIRCFGAPIN
jgi:hypothetical protein